MAAAMTQTSLRETKKQRTRLRILEIALKVFHRDGFVATRLAEVARQAEISDQTMFNNFTSKEVLFEAAVVDWLQARGPDIDAAIPVANLSDDEAFTPPLDQWLGFVHEYRWLLSMAAVHTDLFVPYRRQALPTIEINYLVRRQRIDELQRLGRIRSDIGVERICSLYQAIRDHVVGRWLVGADQTLATLQEEYRSNMAIFMAGIAAPAAPRTKPRPR
jgi:AcrR family transcriptional regulator